MQWALADRDAITTRTFCGGTVSTIVQLVEWWVVHMYTSREEAYLLRYQHLLEGTFYPHATVLHRYLVTKYPPYSHDSFHTATAAALN